MNAGIFPNCLRAQTILLMLVLVGCGTTGSKRANSGPSMEAQFGEEFTYVEIESTRQISAKSCGAAALSCILSYWEKPVGVRTLLERYPMEGEIGYPLLQLRRMALDEKLLAFALKMDQEPAQQLSEHLGKGRPVLIAVQCPYGRYFGKAVPIVESLDSRSVWNVGERWKAHYLVVCGESSDEYLVMDPAYGIVRVAKASLLDFWQRSGHAALVCAAH